MSIMEHVCLASSDADSEKERHRLDAHIQNEVRLALRIQDELDCSWDQALAFAHTRFDAAQAERALA